MIHACLKAGDLDRAQKWFDHMVEQPGLQSANFCGILSACMKLGQHTLVESWFERLHSLGIPAQVLHYNTVISACGRAGRAGRAEEWLRILCEAADKEAKRTGKTHEELTLAPTRRSFTTTAKAWAMLGDSEGVERVLGEMERRGFEMDAWGLTVLLSSYLRGRGQRGCRGSGAAWTAKARGEAAFRKHVEAGLEP